MSIMITDPTLLAHLNAAKGIIEVCGPDGRVLGTFIQEGYGKTPPGVKSPISDEEFEEACKQPDSGITLQEFWQRMQSDGKWR
jgi:hypothetical protein